MAHACRQVCGQQAERPLPYPGEQGLKRGALSGRGREGGRGLARGGAACHRLQGTRSAARIAHDAHTGTNTVIFLSSAHLILFFLFYMRLLSPIFCWSCLPACEAKDFAQLITHTI